MAEWGLPRADGSYAQAMLPERYDVASAEARAGRRGLLDSGPYAPERERRTRSIAVDPADQDEVYAAQVAELERGFSLPEPGGPPRFEHS